MPITRLVQRCIDLMEYGYSVEKGALRVAEIYGADEQELLNALIDYIINNSEEFNG